MIERSGLCQIKALNLLFPKYNVTPIISAPTVYIYIYIYIIMAFNFSLIFFINVHYLITISNIEKVLVPPPPPLPAATAAMLHEDDNLLLNNP